MADAETMADELQTPVRFDTKVAILLRDDLRPWQELNVTAFVMSAIATSADALVGDVYEDSDGQRYLPMLRQPVMIYSASIDDLRAAHRRAIDRQLAMAIYTGALFSTDHDAANRAAVRSVATADLDLVGLGLRGPRNAIDRTVKGARLHD